MSKEPSSFRNAVGLNRSISGQRATITKICEEGKITPPPLLLEAKPSEFISLFGQADIHVLHLSSWP